MTATVASSACLMRSEVHWEMGRRKEGVQVKWVLVKGYR